MLNCTYRRTENRGRRRFSHKQGSYTPPPPSPPDSYVGRGRSDRQSPSTPRHHSYHSSERHTQSPRERSRVPSRHRSRSRSHSRSNPNLGDRREQDWSERGNRSHSRRRHRSSSRRHRSHRRPHSCSCSRPRSRSASRSRHRQKGKQAARYALATPTEQRGQKRQLISTVVIPIPYAKNFEAGWRDYMPLSGFTAAKCSVHFASSQKDVVTPAGGSTAVATLQRDGTLNVKADHFSTRDEMKLGYNDFGPAVKNFVLAIRTHLIACGYERVGSSQALEIANMYQKFFDDIRFGMSDFEEEYDVYLDYIATMMHQWFTYRGRGVVLDEFDKELFDKLVRTHTHKALAGRAQASSAPRGPLGGAPSSSFSFSYPAPDRGQHSFRNASTTANYQPRSSANSTQPAQRVRCSLCRGNHPWAKHQGDSAIFLRRASNGRTWEDAKGDQYCHLYNNFRGCIRSPCPYLHKCTLCGGTHSAQQCRAGQ